MLKAMKRLEKSRKHKIRDKTSYSRRKWSIMPRDEHLAVNLGANSAADNVNDITDSDYDSAIDICHEKATQGSR